MKKILLFAAIVISAAFVSCGKSAKADLKNDVDSVSYAIGQLNGSQLQGYAIKQMGVDSLYFDELLKGMSDAILASGDKKKEAYLKGITMGQQMAEGLNRQIFMGDSVKHLSYQNLMAGILAGVSGDTTVFNLAILEPMIDPMVKKIQEEIMVKKTMELEKENAVKFKDNKEKSEKFIAENAKKEGVKTLPSGVQYKVLKEGTGAKPKDGDNVKVNYEGKLIDGTVFDSSYERGQAAPMSLAKGALIDGFREALLNMPVGSTWEVYIPADKAYGGRQQGPIQPFSALIFKIDLLSIDAPAQPAAAPAQPAQTKK
ncbi:MAG: FKBP-type peptidyl-prolyl cis-trans isomerase [Prevotella sp.]|nr:FKBP-type peptidyl-prolyl cis-trans isomerase [Prevotella sp.]